MSIKIMMASVLTFVTGFLGGFDNLLYALLVLVIVDYATGILAALYTRSVSSYVGLRGIIKKLMLILLVGVAATLDGVMGLSDPWIRTAVISFILMNEGISIIENMARAGVPVPDFLKNVLAQVGQKSGGRL